MKLSEKGFKKCFHIAFIYNFGKYNVHEYRLQQLLQQQGKISLQAVSRFLKALDKPEVKGKHADVKTFTQK